MLQLQMLWPNATVDEEKILDFLYQYFGVLQQ